SSSPSPGTGSAVSRTSRRPPRNTTARIFLLLVVIGSPTRQARIGVPSGTSWSSTNVNTPPRSPAHPRADSRGVPREAERPGATQHHPGDAGLLEEAQV